MGLLTDVDRLYPIPRLADQLSELLPDKEEAGVLDAEDQDTGDDMTLEASEVLERVLVPLKEGVDEMIDVIEDIAEVAETERLCELRLLEDEVTEVLQMAESVELLLPKLIFCKVDFQSRCSETNEGRYVEQDTRVNDARFAYQDG